MFKEKLELMNAISDKKKEIREGINAWTMDQVNDAKKDLANLQAKFDLMADIQDDVIEEAPAEKPVANDAVHEFAEAARSRFTNLNKEGTNADGGYTVPQDIQTKINRYREAEFSLQSLVSTEKVNTMSGARTYLKKASHTGFSSVNEAAKIGAKSGPEFERVTYTITKYAGYLPVTNELLADSDAAISSLLIEWLGKEDVATRNSLILTAIGTKAQTNLQNLDGVKKALNVTLGQAYAPGAVIVTNDDGLNYLDTLKDQNNRYLLQPDITPDNPFSMTLAVGAKRVPIVVVPNAVLATSSSKVPFIIGDLKEYVRIFDRQQLSIMTSNVAVVGSDATALNAFEEDLTIFRGIIRLSAVVVDSAAIVNGYITVESGETGATGDTGETEAAETGGSGEE